MAAKVKKFTCKTGIVEDQFSFTIQWNIGRELMQEFFDKPKTMMESATFKTNFHETCWKLRMYYNKENIEIPELRMVLVNDNSEVKNLWIQCTYFCLRHLDNENYKMKTKWCRNKAKPFFTMSQTRVYMPCLVQ